METGYKRVVKLAVFATVYDVRALHNQAMNVLRSKFDDREWTHQPFILAEVYSRLGDETQLKAFVRASIGGIKESSLRESATDQSITLKWKDAFMMHPELGYDFFLADDTRWNLRENVALVDFTYITI